MATARPPSIDPVAAARWHRSAPARSPWLHEEVGRRMADRLQWIRLEPATWVDWEPVRGGLESHRLVAARYPRARCWVVEARADHADAVRGELGRKWWQLGAPAVHVGEPPEPGAQMLWANMAMHMAADPQTLVSRWHHMLAVNGFLMFSCLGPDTVRELRQLYARLGWPAPSHEFTDMHDWGDMLVHAGFAEPVMDMERITLTWESPARLLSEMRELGANLSRGRFPTLRGRRWRAVLEKAMDESLRGPDGRLALTFEIVYGHALKPQPRVPMAGESAVSADDMRAMLRSGRKPGAKSS